MTMLMLIIISHEDKSELINPCHCQIQTKFTRSEAQDPDACPYDQSASLEEQVHTSIQTSLHHLRHRPDLDAINDDAVYLDCLVLHSPFPLAQFDDTLTVWRTMSSYVPHKVRALGVANLSHEHLVRLYDAVATKPSYVQNRLHAQTGWECPQRQFCQAHGLTFQAHKVLKQKEEMLASDLVGEVAAALGGLSRQTALYLCFLGLGAYMTIVNGTKSEEHMKEDRECLERFEGWIAETNNQVLWERFMAHFKEMIGE